MRASLPAHKGQGEPVLTCSCHLLGRAGRECGRLSFVSGEIQVLGKRARLTERATLAGDVGELDLEDHALAVWARQGVDGTLYIASVGIRALGESSIGQSRLVDSSNRVVVDFCGITKFLGRS